MLDQVAGLRSTRRCPRRSSDSPSRSGSRPGCSAVFACNAYVDAMAPWALRKTDPERMAAVLGTLVAAIRAARRRHRAGHSGLGREADRIDRRREGRAADRAADRRCSRGSSSRRGGGGVRLIDSHCHLNYEGLVERQDEVLDSCPGARASPASSTSRPGRSEWGDVIAAAERNPDVWASVGVHPHEADAHPDLGAAALVEAPEHPRVDRDRRMRARLLLRQVRPRRAARAVRGAYRGGAGDRPAAGRPHPRCRGGHGGDPRPRRSRKGGVTGVLHCFTGSGRAGAQGAGPRLLSSRCRGS